MLIKKIRQENHNTPDIGKGQLSEKVGEFPLQLHCKQQEQCTSIQLGYLLLTYDI